MIPFVGAGFSAAVGLPGWAGLLQRVASDLRIAEDDSQLDFDRLYRDSSDDFLRVAEYLYIRAGSNIGPLRLSISHALTIRDSLASSTPHVELLNLGAPQVYTTNFDDGIERTYRELKQPMEVVALPRDVAVADPQQTQIVKYHGDLRYDDTLVLTESQYWKRLDLESPMDLKFRSDLLGRSVLFMGYSFSDINIRVIWFKLMQMMEDVPESDRKPSYIVRFEPNPVLEALYKSVGLTTIVLDPEEKASNDADRTALLGEFLTDLASAAAGDGGIPGNTQQALFASKGLIYKADDEISQRQGQFPWLPAMEALGTLTKRDVPPALKAEAFAIVERLAKADTFIVFQVNQVIAWACKVWGPKPAITSLAIQGVITRMTRKSVLTTTGVPWKTIWETNLPEDLARPILRAADVQIRSHGTRGTEEDQDVAYAIDALKRLAAGLAADPAVREEARELLASVSQLYPSSEGYEPSEDGPPQPGIILKEIADRKESEKKEQSAV